MPVKIHRQEDENSIPVRAMEDGQIGEIVEWGAHTTTAMGQIVQRVRDDIIQIGCHCGKSYSGTAKTESKDMRVRILPKGTLLEIV